LTAAVYVAFSTVPIEPHNLIRLSFLDSRFRELYADDWENYGVQARPFCA
jgi:hypothetical protein